MLHPTQYGLRSKQVCVCVCVCVCVYCIYRGLNLTVNLTLPSSYLINVSFVIITLNLVLSWPGYEGYLHRFCELYMRRMGWDGMR